MIPSILPSKISAKQLPYLDAVKAGIIEEPIAGLVKALNIGGICGTRISCAGHPFFGFRTKEDPCVAFVSDTRWAMVISQMLEDYLYQPVNPLNYYWTLSGRIFEGVGLSWTLSIRDCNTLLLSKSKLASDFKVLQIDIDRLSTEFQERVVLGDVNVPKETDDTQNYQKFEPACLCDFSKGIGVSAF